MALVEFQPEDLGIVFIELELVFRFVPLLELNIGPWWQRLVTIKSKTWIWAGRSTNRSSNTRWGVVAMANVFRVDVRVETMEKENWDFKECED